MNKNLKKLAIITLAILFALTTTVTALVAIFHQSETPKATADVEITVPVISEDDESQEAPEKEEIPETKVLLVDASGSMRLGGSTVLPVRLRGNMRDPKYSLDMRSSAKPASLDITIDGDFAKKIDDIIGASR